MDQLRDPRKEHSAVNVKSSARRIKWCGWGMFALSVMLCGAPLSAQQRTHNPFANPKPTPTQPSTGTPPSTPAQPQQPAPSQPQAPKPPTTIPSGGTASVAMASDGMRGLLAAVNPAGSVTLARTGYPPVVIRVPASAVITRDGAPAGLNKLEGRSQTTFPDLVLVSAAPAADGTLVAAKIKATSRAHFWYGRIAGIDAGNSLITVVRADGQRRSFHLNSRTTVSQFGGTNVAWSAMKVGGVVEVVWVPGDSEPGAAILEAQKVILNKPYEGIRLQAAPRR
jgi:hypothetical protein